MNHKQNIRWLWLIAIIVIITISCNLVGSIIENQIDKTATSQVASVTSQTSSVVTEAGIESITTQVNPEEIVNSLGELMSGGGTSTPPPEDVPIMPSNEELFTTSTSIEFSVQNSTKEVVDFYEKEMPLKGWTKNASESKVEEGVTTLVFTKDNRKATINIEEDLFGGTSVTIEITQS